ncbi:histone deacetylase complex protein [Cyathus striatus]|nr:histone deacetylase complex protein [Cyathus striatus]
MLWTWTLNIHQGQPPLDAKQPDCNVGYIYSAEMTCHFHPEGHPEKPERIERIWRALVDRNYTVKMKWLPIRAVRKEEAMLIHSEDHWNKVLAIQHMTDQERADSEEYYEQLSLYVMGGTTRAALLSCGGAIEACLAVARGSLRKSFAIVRPPGHHAEPEEHMGFCFFNNVAVAARVVQQVTSIKKILILDWDVHHGNGTQRAFNDDSSVLYISLHRYERGTFYPCGPFGGMSSCGEGRGLGYSVNIPWPEAGMGDAEYIHAFQKIVMPIAMEFAPELVIISAGFDAAKGDELGECFVTPTGYAHMTHMLSGLAGGRLVVALEGGYNLDSISNSAVAVTRVILGEPPDPLGSLTVKDTATETIWLVAREQSKYWRNVDPKLCEPREGFENSSFSVQEILKAHRQYYLYTNYEMMQIPLMNQELEQKFSTQIMCTSDIFENDTLIVFVHEFGNLRMELESALECNVELERSYLIDFSRELVSWVRKEKYALLDVNLFAKPVDTRPSRSKQTDDPAKEIMTYLWDNYIQLSTAQRVIFIGHGPGCQPLVDLADRRSVGVNRTVKAMIQIVSHQKMPGVPSENPDILQWYRKFIDQSNTRLMIAALPGIKQFTRETLEQYPVSAVSRVPPMNTITY